MNKRRKQGLYALGIILGALGAGSCLWPTGIEIRGLVDVNMTIEGVIWIGQASSHAEAVAAYNKKLGRPLDSPPEERWSYRNIYNQNIYVYNGTGWVIRTPADQPTIVSNLKIVGDYIPEPEYYYPVRAYFTDGGIADGYIEEGSGQIKFYDDVWNDDGRGQTFFMLEVLESHEEILLGCEFDVSDTVELNVDDQGKLQFHEQVTNPNDSQLYTPIGTVGEFQMVNDLVRYPDALDAGKKYLQTRDLDLLGAPSNGKKFAPLLYNWDPIGHVAKTRDLQTGKITSYFYLPFKGTFDGGGKKLKNLYVYSTHTSYPPANRPSLPEAYGLFGYVEGGTLKNITVASGSVTAVTMAAGITGKALNVTIDRCVNKAAITATDTETPSNPAAGGIVGRIRATVGSTRSTITRCANGGKIYSAEAHAGGIGGSLEYVTIRGSYNTGEVEGSSRVGGIVGVIGSSAGDEIIACYNTGYVHNYGNIGVGGLVGTGDNFDIRVSYNTGTVENCYTGPDASYEAKGWLIGHIMQSTTANVADCYWLELNPSVRAFYDEAPETNLKYPGEPGYYEYRLTQLYGIYWNLDYKPSMPSYERFKPEWRQGQAELRLPVTAWFDRYMGYPFTDTGYLYVTSTFAANNPAAGPFGVMKTSNPSGPGIPPLSGPARIWPTNNYAWTESQDWAQNSLNGPWVPGANGLGAGSSFPKLAWDSNEDAVK